jgi:hypothetical protein
MTLGKIIKSNSHTDYVCQVFGPGEIPDPPHRHDHAFGTFVSVALGDEGWLIGLIYDTVLFNPEFGRLGPRLSPETELAVFSPDYLVEKAILVGITAIGTLDASNIASQGVPPVAATSDALVERMNGDQIRAFHSGQLTPQLDYMPLLLAQDSPRTLPLLLSVTDQLIELFPAHVRLLSVLQGDLAWKAQVSPLGGAR